MSDTKKNQSGYTLIELSLGLVIVALVVAGLLTGVQKILNQITFNKSVDQMVTAIEKIKLMTRRNATSAYFTALNGNNSGILDGLREEGTNRNRYTESGFLVQVFGSDAIRVGGSYIFRVWPNSSGECTDIANALEPLAVWVGTTNDASANTDSTTAYYWIKKGGAYYSANAATACSAQNTGNYALDFVVTDIK